MDIENREKLFKESVHRMIGFEWTMREEFIQYWTEPNKSGSKMKYEMERTWDLKRRLHRWENNQEQKGFKAPKDAVVHKMNVVPAKIPQSNIEKLDAFLERYCERSEDIKFQEFGYWYEFMKAEKLLRQFTKGEVFELLSVYDNDKQKCRCAAVQLTMNEYVNTGFTFSKRMQVRKQLTQ